MESTTLFTSSAPGTPGVGGILIEQMLECHGVQPITIASIIDKQLQKHITPKHANGVRLFSPVDEFYDPSHRGNIGTLKRLKRRHFHYDQSIRDLANQLRRQLEQDRPEQLWLILNSLATIDVASTLIPNLECKVLVQIWDDPEHLCLQRHCDRLTRQRTMSRFRKLLSRADRTAVICQQMREAYRPYVSSDPIIIRLGTDTEGLEPRWQPSHANEFRIGLSGSMYCESEWRVLQQTCDQMGWKVDGRQIVLVVVGGRIEFCSRANAECRFYGWRSPQETHQLMIDCDLLYLPQSAAPENDPLTRLSFPTKLSSYAATGRPILVQSPKKGSLRPFCREHQFGIVCDSDDSDGIAQSIRRIATDASFRSEQAHASCRIAQEVLTRKAFCKGVRSLLGITNAKVANRTRFDSDPCTKANHT